MIERTYFNGEFVTIDRLFRHTYDLLAKYDYTSKNTHPFFDWPNDKLIIEFPDNNFLANKPILKDLKKLESNSHFSMVFTAPEEAGDLGDLIQRIAATEDHLVPHVSFDHEKKKINLHYPDSVKRKQKQKIGKNIKDFSKTDAPGLEGYKTKIETEYRKKQEPVPTQFESLKALKKSYFFDALLKGIGSCGHIGDSCFLLNLGGKNLLLDCGYDISSDMAPKITKEEIESIDLVILSHAHQDHSGLIPYLYANGCEASLLTTRPTIDISDVLWRDSLKIARIENKTQPFSLEDIEKTMEKKATIPYNLKYGLDDVVIEFFNAGHILGSTVTKITYKDQNIVYTGDIALFNSYILKMANMPENIDYLILETTNADQEFKKYTRRVDKMLKNIRATLDNGGTVLIPCFAVGRSQEILEIFSKFRNSKGEYMVGDYPIHVDGMIKKIIDIYKDYGKSYALTDSFSRFDKGFKIVNGWQDRIDIKQNNDPKIILSTSGMLNGGPAMGYLNNLSKDPKNLIIFVGYQAQNTLGRKLLDNPKYYYDPSSKKAFELGARVENARLSSHADSPQLMTAFSRMPIKKIITVHGEGNSINSFTEYAKENFKAKEVIQLKPAEEIVLF